MTLPVHSYTGKGKGISVETGILIFLQFFTKNVFTSLVNTNIIINVNEMINKNNIININNNIKENVKMRKFNAIYKRNNEAVVIEMEFENVADMVFTVINSKGRKVVKEATIKRWYDIKEEIIEKKVEEKKPAAKKSKKVYSYEYLYRGFSIGCQPKDFISHDDSYGRFGSVSYERKLTAEEVESFELKEIKKERRHSRTEVKKDGTVREDKFKPKLNAEDAMSILEAYHSGSKKAHLAKEYGVSFRTITCIVEGLMWKDVFAQYHGNIGA